MPTHGDEAVQTTLRFSVHADRRPDVVLTARATDDDGDPLSFTWRTNDGTLASAIGDTTTWTLPHGGGLHSA